ncbi:non-ribosomal peptide synthetase [Salinispora oceanensis]|uniref:non-ribosomal peptide synthetase n=1 Tax=Salinispora oceanensis TaxID=1050199 RepID=UPI00047FF548|nr:non-ribosomal peptide synthetase [Salinispora oceanensis]
MGDGRVHDGVPANGIHELVEQQAARTPSAPAVQLDDEVWNYDRLNERANAIGHRLRQLGAGPGDHVAVTAARSPQLVAAVLGVWKAGGAVIALESHQDIVRMHRSAPAAAPRIAIRTGERPEIPGVEVWLDLGTETGPPTGNPAACTRPDDAAYVVFTSGSSGTPKGIVGTHRGVLNYFDDLRRRNHLAEGDAVVQLSAASFDAMLRDMFFPLTVGARTVIAPRGGRDVAAVLDLLVGSGATAVVAIVPSVLRELVREAGRSGVTVPRVRTVLVSGERLYHADVEAAREVLPNARLHNLYGPSECTMTTTTHDADDGSTTGGGVPIGRPISGTTAYVLDRALNLTPPGYVGELFIAGAGVTRGYWNRPALTAERFVPNPYGHAGERMYRTGDRARLRPDGVLEFLGRTDDQVKIRGQRVELGEVESALLGVPEIREAACRVWDETGALIAYLVWTQGHEPVTASELRARLAHLLPEYMLPDLFLSLDRLPRTTSGKVDRRALPDQRTLPRSETLGDAVAPRDAAEERMAGVWRDLLGVRSLGVHDSFFELGGHSLLAMRLVALIADSFGVEVPLRAVFAAPTIAALTGYVARRPADGRRRPGPTPAPRGPRQLSPAQAHVWSLERLAPGGSCYNVAGIIRLRGVLDVDAMSRATTEIVRRHEALRTTFPEVDGVPMVRVQPPGPVRLSVVDLGVAGGESALRAAVRELALTGFDLANGPLVRVGLLRISPVEHVHYLVVHHIVFDGWSMATYLRELTVLYQAFVEGRPSPLPEPPLQYGDLATWQAEQVASGAWDDDIGYWRAQLAGATPIVRIPDGYPFISEAHRNRGQRMCTIDAEVTRRLAERAADIKATPSMMLMAAYQVALHVTCGAVNFHVAMPVANRISPETDHMIGFVANTLLIRADLSGDPTLSELAHRTRETLLDGYAHADAPLEDVVRRLLPDAATPDLLLAQAMFNMQEVALASVEAGALALEAADTADVWSRHPVALFVNQEPTATRLHLVYDSALFDGEWADRFTVTLRAAVDAIAGGRDDRVGALRTAA